MNNKVYYDSDDDQIYILTDSIAWAEVSGCVVFTLFCSDCNFWHYIGEFEV